MLPPTHLASGYLLGSITKKQDQLKWTSIVSFFAVFPDIDLLWLWESHRFSALHFPSFWIGVYLLLSVISKLLNKPQLGTYASAMLLGSLSHIALDSVGIFEGIYWLYPLNTIKYSLLPISITLPSHDILAMISVYFQHPIMIIETALWAAAIGYELQQKVVIKTLSAVVSFLKLKLPTDK